MSRRRLLAIWLLCALVFAAMLAVRDAAGQTGQPGPIFRSGTELVLVNAVVRDRNGAPVRGLSASDFTVTEDGRPQQIQSFDFEELPSTGALAPGAQPVVAPILTQSGNAAPAAQREVDLRGHRLVVLFFDLSSMQEAEFNRAIDSARSYVTAKVSTADLVAIASFSASLQVLQDFTPITIGFSPRWTGWTARRATGWLARSAAPTLHLTAATRSRRMTRSTTSSPTIGG